MTGLAGFRDGPAWHWLVGHWHGRLDGALAKEAAVGRPVFAADGGHGGAAEWQRQGPACGAAQSPSRSVSLL